MSCNATGTISSLQVLGIRSDLWFKRFDPETPIEETVRSSLASAVAKL